MGAPTLDDLGALVALWQQRLELQDWHVEVTYARAGRAYRVGVHDGDESGA
jgi:hypothetical protein